MIFRQLVRNFGGNKLIWLNVFALSSNFRYGWFLWTLPTSLTRTGLTQNYLTWTIIFHLLTEKRNRNEQQQQPQATVLDITEFTQQDGRKKRTANPLCVTNVTRPLLVCFLVNFININVFWSVTKLKDLFKKFESEVWRKVISNKIIVTLVTQGLLSSFLSRPVA